MVSEATATATFVFGDAIGSLVSWIVFSSINLFVPDLLEAPSSLVRTAFHGSACWELS